MACESTLNTFCTAFASLVGAKIPRSGIDFCAYERSKCEMGDAFCFRQ
jgi:hypothetical protein